MAAKAGKTSKASQRKGSDYSEILRKLEAWNKDHRGGKGLNSVETVSARSALDEVGEQVAAWLAAHPKKLIETPQTGKRRKHLQELQAQIERARSTLGSVWRPALTAVEDWERTVREVNLDTLAAARLVVNTLDSAVERAGADTSEQAELARERLGTFREEVVRFESRARNVLTVAERQWRELLDGDVLAAPTELCEQRLDALVRATRIATRAFPDRDLTEVVALVDHGKALLRWREAHAGLVEGFRRTWTEFQDRFPDDLEITSDGDAELVDELHRRLELLAAMPRELPRPPEEAEAVHRLATAARARVDAGKLRLLTVAHELKNAFPHGVSSVAELSCARPLRDALEAAMLNLGSPESEIPARVRRFLRTFELSIQRLALSDTTTDDEREDATLGREQDEAHRLQLEQEEAALWREEVDEAWASGKYGPKRKVGSGGLGAVHLLHPKSPDLPSIVVKTFSDPSEVDVEATAYERAGVHPNLPRCLGVRELDGERVLVLEALDGGEMFDAVVRGIEAVDSGRITHTQYWGAVQHMLRGMIHGLKHLRDQGLGHSDAKPENVMIDRATGDAVVIDLGSLRDIGSPGPEAVSKGYVPADEEPVGESRDAFAVGGTAYTAGRGRRFQYGLKEAITQTQVNKYFSNPELTVWAKKGAAANLRDGSIGADTQYIAFTEALMEKDPSKRLTYEQALEHPFLADPLLPQDEARAAVRRLSSL